MSISQSDKRAFLARVASATNSLGTPRALHLQFGAFVYKLDFCPGREAGENLNSFHVVALLCISQRNDVLIREAALRHGFWKRVCHHEEGDEDCEDGDECSLNGLVQRGGVFYTSTEVTGFTVNTDDSSIDHNSDETIDKAFSFFVRLRNVKLCGTCKLHFSFDINEDCIGCALDSLVAPRTLPNDTCPICLETVRSRDVTACCARPMHKACSLGLEQQSARAVGGIHSRLF